MEKLLEEREKYELPDGFNHLDYVEFFPNLNKNYSKIMKHYFIHGKNHTTPKFNENTFNMIKNIKKSGAFVSNFNSGHIYSNLLYGDSKNKICICFTPRGGCSVSFQCYLDLFGLLNDGLSYHPFIHNDRCDIFHRFINYKDINDLKKENYKIIKFVMNQ